MKDVWLDLSAGRVSVTFQSGKSAKPAALWGAIQASGFTPDRIEMKGTVYKGPKP